MPDKQQVSVSHGSCMFVYNVCAQCEEQRSIVPEALRAYHLLEQQNQLGRVVFALKYLDSESDSHLCLDPTTKLQCRDYNHSTFTLMSN